MALTMSFDVGRQVKTKLPDIEQAITAVKDVMEDSCSVARDSGSDVMIAAAEDFENATTAMLKALTELFDYGEKFVDFYAKAENANARH